MYAVRSKGQMLLIRDGKTGVMKKYGPREWVTVEQLPSGMLPIDTLTTEVRIIEDMGDAREPLLEEQAFPARLEEDYQPKKRGKQKGGRL